jgi:Flp pilus assembly protein TadD
MHLWLLLALASSPSDWAPYQASPKDHKAEYRLAVQLIAERKFGEATAVLNEVAQQEPRWAEIFSARCSAQLGLKRPDSAAADCRYALQVKPELVVALYGLATAERLLGQNPQAAAHFRQYASSTNPDATPELKAAARKAADELEGTASASAIAPAPASEQRVAEAVEAVRHPAKPGACKDTAETTTRGCTERKGPGDFCQSDLDCGSGLWCKDPGSGLKSCTR